MKIIFDLDGTLSDPADGIVNGYNYAFAQHGLQVLERNVLTRLIGPQLDVGLRSLLPEASDDFIKALIHTYREYYGETGYAENILYPGMDSLLEQLKQQGLTLGVCTSKRVDFAERILEMFNIRQHFEFVSGGDFGISKSQQMTGLIEEGKVNAGDVMIGDRLHDVGAAKDNGLLPIGVLWGYGSYNELTKAGAELLLTSVEEAAPILMEVTNLED